MNDVGGALKIQEDAWVGSYVTHSLDVCGRM
jgi:hypothetical protein